LTLSQLGDLGDFLGGIGVIVTLLYLALQIRRNTQSVHAASLDSVAESHLEFLRSVGQDPALSKLWFNGLSGKLDLAETDGQQFGMLLLSVARLWERAFHMNRVGALDSLSWAGIGTELTLVLATPGGQAFWKTRQPMFSPDFVVYVEEAVERAKRPPREPAV
jgi:hypothetical protein